MVDRLFPREVLTLASSSEFGAEGLHPEELDSIRRASSKRISDYAAGRTLAREALSRLGAAPSPLLPGPRRAPVWPPGMVGSISHCQGLCGVAVARVGRILGLGLDLETGEPLPGELVERVVTEREMVWAAGAEDPPVADWFKFLFSAKEGVYKALFPLTGMEFEFLDVEVQLRPQLGTFEVRFPEHPIGEWVAGKSLTGRFAATATHLATGVVLTHVPNGELTAPNPGY